MTHHLFRNAITSVALAATVNILATMKPADAATVKLVGLSANNTLVSFDSDNPLNTSSVGITGVDGTLLGIDFRPANGLLYGVTRSSIYSINTNTGAATFVSALSTALNSGLESGVDFNPVVDRLRLVGSNDQNLRANVDTGVVMPDAPLAYAGGDTNAGKNPNVTGAAYTNSFAGASTTTLFDIDYVLDVLVRQNPPNNGFLNTVGSLGIDFGSTGGFDIFSPSEGQNFAFAASNSTLYSIDLTTGAATTLGIIGNGDIAITGLAATVVPEPITMTGAFLGLGGLAFLKRRYGRVKN